jgi:cytochrome c
MDAFELNKVAAAVLSALLVIFGSRALYDSVASDRNATKTPGYTLPFADRSLPTRKQQVTPAFDSRKVVALLPKASAEAGRDAFRRCQQCHTVDKGGRNLVGPNLWGVVGRKVGGIEGFAYSEALKNHRGDWTIDELARYLHDPKAAIPGNKMAFPGVKDDVELADLLTYLRTLADTPPRPPG